MQQQTKQLERVFMWWPRVAPVASRMVAEDFFVFNACEGLDWELKDAQAYIAAHPGAKLWSVTEDEGNMYLWECFRFVNRQYYLVQSESYKGDLLWRQRVRN